MTDYTKLNSLVVEAKNGDKSAFDEIYRLTARTQYYYISRILHDPGEVQDALQETYLILYKNIGRIDPPGALNAYLNRLSYFVSKNMSKCQARRQHRAVGIEQAENYPEDKPIPQEQVENRERIELIRSAVMELPKQQQSVIVMRYYQNLTMQEISYSMGISRSTAQRLYRAAKEQLKVLLKEKGIYTAFGVVPGASAAVGKVVENTSVPLEAPASSTPSQLLSTESMEKTIEETVLKKAPSHLTGAATAAKCAVILAGLSCTAAITASAVTAPRVASIDVPPKWQIEKAKLVIHTKSVFPISQVTVQKQGSKARLAVPQEEDVYSFTVTENGRYSVTVATSNGRTAQYITQVDCIDTILPKASLKKREGRKIWIAFSENETGMDYSSIHCVSDTGVVTRPISVDPDSLTVLFELPEENQQLIYSDRAGNAAQAPLVLEDEE